MTISPVALSVTAATTLNSAYFCVSTVKLPVGRVDEVISTKEALLNRSEIDVNVMSSSPVLGTRIV